MKILPCPFCGDDDPLHDEISPDVFAVICGTCGTIGPSYHGEAGGVSDQLETLLPTTTIDYAVGAWNSRAKADMPAKIKQLREDWYAEMELVERLRGLLREYLENDLTDEWEYDFLKRIREALGDGD